MKGANIFFIVKNLRHLAAGIDTNLISTAATISRSGPLRVPTNKNSVLGWCFFISRATAKTGLTGPPDPPPASNIFSPLEVFIFINKSKITIFNVYRFEI
jgi:hypothetical protein